MVSPLILLCLLRALWRTLRHGGGHVVSGHDYEGDESPTPDNIHVMRCSTCGHQVIDWGWSADVIKKG